MINADFMWNLIYFFFPIRYGWLEIAERLLKKRNVRMMNLQNNQGKTALHFACHEGHEQIAQLLLVEGATIERYFSDKLFPWQIVRRGDERNVLCELEFFYTNSPSWHKWSALNKSLSRPSRMYFNNAFYQLISPSIWVGHSVGWTNSQPWSVTQSVRQSVSLNQLVSQPVNESIYRSVGQSVANSFYKGHNTVIYSCKQTSRTSHHCYKLYIWGPTVKEMVYTTIKQSIHYRYLN